MLDRYVIKSALLSRLNAPIAVQTTAANIPANVGSHNQGFTKLVRAWSRTLEITVARMNMPVIKK